MSIDRNVLNSIFLTVWYFTDNLCFLLPECSRPKVFRPLSDRCTLLPTSSLPLKTTSKMKNNNDDIHQNKNNNDDSSVLWTSQKRKNREIFKCMTSRIFPREGWRPLLKNVSLHGYLTTYRYLCCCLFKIKNSKIFQFFVIKITWFWIQIRIQRKSWIQQLHFKNTNFI